MYFFPHSHILTKPHLDPIKATQELVLKIYKKWVQSAKYRKNYNQDKIPSLCVRTAAFGDDDLSA